MIQFDASESTLPISLFALFNELTTKYKSFIQFYFHGTIVKEQQKLTRLNSLIELFSNLKLTLNNAQRNAYDYGVTFIAKKFTENERLLGKAVLTLPQTNGKRIYGMCFAILFIYI